MVYQDHKDHREYLVPREQLVKKVIVETQVYKDHKENKESRVHQQEGQYMYDGGGPLVPLTKELNYYTLEELEGVCGIIKELVLTISVCQMTLIICSMTVEYRDIALYME